MNDSWFYIFVIGIIALLSLGFSIITIGRINKLEAELAKARVQITAHENHKFPADCDQAIMHWAACPMTAAMGGSHE